MVLSAYSTLHRSIAGCNPLCSAAIYVSTPILTYRGRNCKGVFGKVCKNRLFRFFIDISWTCWFFQQYFEVLAVFDKNRSFLHHGQDMLKFGFFLNLTADFGAIFFKKSGGAKTAFIAFRGQVVFLGQAWLMQEKKHSSRFLLHFRDMLRFLKER